MARAISTVLIDANEVFREGLRQVLANTRFRVRGGSGTLNNALLKIPFNRRPLLLLLGVAGTLSPVSIDITRLKASNPDFKLVVLGDNCPIEQIPSVFQAGANGYLSKESTREALIKSLELIMLGALVLYTEGMGQLFDLDKIQNNETHTGLDKIQNNETDTGPQASHRLSERQLEILRCLTNGESNKGIARKYGIAEATVKVHMKTILQKISVRNRTQAAIWARENVPCVDSHPGSLAGRPLFMSSWVIRQRPKS